MFAVEDRTVQLTWPWTAGSDLRVEVGPTEVPIAVTPPAYLRRRGRRPHQIGPGPGGPGAVVVGGLEPATTYDITVAGADVARRQIGRVTTLAPPPGRLLTRFATVNDVHLGERAFGGLATIIDRLPLPIDMAPYPERCARAAIAEATGWGAERLVVKGDLTRDSEPVEFREVGRLLAGAPLPVDVILGNHDVRHGIDGSAILAECGVSVVAEARAVDVDGLRIILGHSPVSSERRGRLGRPEIDRIVALAAAAAPGPVLVALHHAPQRRALPTIYPPGLYHVESERFLARLREANPACVVVAGHTHRNRSYVVDGVPVVEVGSTKDYPGQWAGYTVHEGGLRQVVRRIADPDAIAWTEATRLALYGGWGRWSSGSLNDRCWAHRW